jgi:hypothetical protein
MRGERNMNSITFSMVEYFIAATPAAQMPEPIRAPMRAWDDDVGRPRNQVMRFQEMAPTSPPSTMKGMMSFSTSPSLMTLEIVDATATPNVNAAMKLKKAARATALVGERTFVDTTVAMELAESWKPLVKSKTSAMMMMMMTITTEDERIMATPPDPPWAGRRGRIGPEARGPPRQPSLAPMIAHSSRTFLLLG